MIKLTITYNDERTLEINDLKAEDVKIFFECLSKGELYWDNSKNRGFWTDSKTIRHIVVTKIATPPKFNVPNKKKVEVRNNTNSEPDKTGVVEWLGHQLEDPKQMPKAEKPPE